MSMLGEPTAPGTPCSASNDKLDNKCLRCRLFYPSKDALAKHSSKNKKCVEKMERTAAAIAAELEGSKKRKSFDVEKEETADYRCAGCAESFAAMVALVGKGTTEVGCEDCAELLRPFEEEFAMKMQRAKQLKKASSKKKEGLRSKELVPEDRKLFFCIVSCLVATEKSNECAIPYKKLNALTYEQFLSPEHRTLVGRLKGILKVDC